MINDFNVFDILFRTLKRTRSSIPVKTLVKLIYINPQLNDPVKDKLPLIFIHYQKIIFIPDFNICTLLKMIHSNIDINTIKDYVRLNIFIRLIIFILGFSN